LVIGRNVRVDIASAYGPPITVTNVACVNPAAVTAPAHGFVEWSAGYFSNVDGMAPLQGQAAIVVAPTVDAFTADGLDTTAYPPFTDSALFVPVASWATLAESTSYQMSEGSTGATQQLNATTILDRQMRSRPSILAQQTVQLSVLPQSIPSAAMRLLQSAALAGAYVVARITLVASGALRVCRGTPSYPTEGAQAEAMGTGSLTLSLDGLFLQLAGLTPPRYQPPLLIKPPPPVPPYQPPSLIEAPPPVPPYQPPPLLKPPPGTQPPPDSGFSVVGYDVDGFDEMQPPTGTTTYSAPDFDVAGYDEVTVQKVVRKERAA
jgi:hypothetical protein